MKFRVSSIPSLIAAVTLASMFVAVACGTAAPQTLEIPVKLEGAKLDPGTIRAGQGDTVTLQIESEEPGDFHIHGYDIEKEVSAGEVTDFTFVSDVTGRFRIAFHPAGSDHESHDESRHGDKIQSPAFNSGDTFALEVSPELAGETIHYHSHLHPELTGVLKITDTAPPAATVPVEIRDTEIHPGEVEVRPGTTVVWTNNSSEIQALASGDHEDATRVEGDDASHEAQHSGSEDSHDEEIDVGFLEVRPR